MKPDYELLWHTFKNRLQTLSEETPLVWKGVTFVPFKNFYDTIKWIVSCMDESEALNVPKKPVCPNCQEYPLEYHEWNCVVDGKETGEIYQVVTCAHCGYVKDIK